MRFILMLLPVFSLVLGSVSCHSQQVSQKKAKPCPPNTICTEIFKMITVKVLDKDHNPVSLDSTVSRVEKTINRLPSTLTTEKMEDNLSREQGFYTVATDADMKFLGRAGKTITFEGYKNGERILSQNMIIGHDCCHVTMIAGDETFILP